MQLSDHLDKIRAFKAVAETGKLREAAQRLHMTQPALSRLVQKLEEAAGAKLLYRSRQGVTLTASGQELLIYINKTLRDLEDAQKRIKAPNSHLAGHLKIGSYETLAEYLWPDFFLHLKKTCPDLVLSIKTTDGLNHSAQLQRGELDLVVDAEPRIYGDFSSWLLYEDRFGFYIHRDLQKELEKSKDPTQFPLIFVGAAFDKENKTILQHIEEAGYRFEEKIALDSFSTAKTFCEKKLGIAVLPQRLAANLSSTSQLRSLKLKHFAATGFGAHGIYATLKSDRAEDARLKYLIRLLKTWFKSDT